MAKRVKGITVEIGGDTSKLDRALKETDTAIARVQRDLRDVERLLKLDPQNVDLLAQKQRLLAERSELAAQRLETMETAAKGLDKTLSKSELDDFNLELDLTKAKAEQAANELDEFTESSKKNKKGLKDFLDPSTSVSEGFSIMKGAAANLVSTGFTKLAEMAVDLIQDFWALDDTTAELRENIALLKTSFDESGLTAGAAKDAYHGLYQILGDSDQATEAAQQMAQLAKNQEELNKWLDIGAGIYGTFGASIPLEGLMESANETAKVGKVTGTLADALNWVGISEDEVNASLEELAVPADRARYLMELLSQQYGDAAEVFKETNQTIMESREAQAQMDDKLAELGGHVAELKTELFDLFGPLLMAGIESVTGLVQGFAKLLEGLGDIVDWLGDKVMSAIDWFRELLGLGREASSAAPSEGGDPPRARAAALFALPEGPPPDIPALASGGVIKPNNPFLAVLGDNTREVEVAAPRSTIVGAVLDAMDMRGGSGPAQQTIGPFIVEMTLDGTKFGRVFIPYLRPGLTRAGIKLK